MDGRWPPGSGPIAHKAGGHSLLCPGLEPGPKPAPGGGRTVLAGRQSALGSQRGFAGILFLLSFVCGFSCVCVCLIFLTFPRAMWDLNSPARDGTHALCVGSTESDPLDLQGGPWHPSFFIKRKDSKFSFFFSFQNTRDPTWSGLSL